ncbi:glycosyltransferase [Microbacterium phage Magritte]|nr:glycosyltransferase [Microbacterium phage Magritte]
MNALFFTAYDRVDYLRQTLQSWESVRGIQDWHVVFRIEPSPHQQDVEVLFRLFAETMMLPSYEIIVNETKLGVLEHPYVGFQELFQRFDFVVRAEDDLLVSDDILEYFSWAAETYENDDTIATINGFSKLAGTDYGIFRQQRFNPWIWGTWKRVWDRLLEPTWDHDYSSFNGVPGVESGWDWNIDTRLLTRFGYSAIYPENSRVQNIGLWGVHGTPENLLVASSFKPVYGRQDYHESA